MTQRLKNKKEIALYLGLSYPSFLDKENKLHAIGFPKQEKVLNKYDIKKVDAWLDNDTIRKDSGIRAAHETQLQVLKRNH